MVAQRQDREVLPVRPDGHSTCRRTEAAMDNRSPGRRPAGARDPPRMRAQRQTMCRQLQT